MNYRIPVIIFMALCATMIIVFFSYSAISIASSKSFESSSMQSFIDIFGIILVPVALFFIFKIWQSTIITLKEAKENKRC